MARFIKFGGTVHEVTSEAVLTAARIKWGDALSEMPIWHSRECVGAGDERISTLDESAWTDEVGAEYRRMTRAGKPQSVGVNYAGF